MLPTLGIVFGVAALCCALVMPAAMGVARAAGLVDRPDGRRKVHGRVVPLAGGAAIYVTLLAVVFGGDAITGFLGPQQAWCGWLLAGAGVICVVGVIDDARGLRGRHKLLGQLVAICVVLCAGPPIDSIHAFGWTLHLGVLSVPFTLFWMLGAVNALNLLDGADGLLGSVGAVICVAMAGMAVLTGHWAAACLAAATAGSLVGFLFYNAPPASTFLGDCGSMLIGLIVGALGLQSALKTPSTIILAAPAAVLVLPVLDTFAAIVRRKLTGRSVFSTDRGHLHHCLLKSGMSPRLVLVLVAALSTLASIGALASLAMRSEELALLAAASVVAILVSTRLFGHAEYLLVKARLLAAAGVASGQRDEQGDKELAVRLQGTLEWEAVWRPVVQQARDLGLLSATLDVNAPALHEGYHARWDRPAAESEAVRIWLTELPLHVHGHDVGRLILRGERSGHTAGSPLAGVADLVNSVEVALEAMLAAPAAMLPRPHVVPVAPRVKRVAALTPVQV